LTDLEKAAAAVSDGDPSAFPKIVAATQDRFVRLSARLLGSIAEAEDVVQEAYLKAYRSLVARRFDGRSKVGTWLHSIVLNTTLDAQRARGRAPPRPANEGAEAGVDGAAHSEARVALRELAGWLGALPEEHRVVIMLKVVEELSSAETAEILGCSEGAVEQRLVRARAALRKWEAARERNPRK
jgi:RNA polymerase sigma-70 factor (ECF subfamily)